MSHQISGIIWRLGQLANERLILSFAPRTLFYSLLKKLGALFPGKSRTTRAYLHSEEEVVRCLQRAGFRVQRSEMTATRFYFSRLLEAVRDQ
ncbi:hypothetical protein EON65_43495 [archaeon]|nr:MAG: hypothetical protein EON65_43495 [archaeon]